jgi:methylmalonyl-CoA/ethylmalonyl-CoA epimerase
MSDDSPVQKFLDKRGGGLHHICFESDALDSDIVNLKEKGYRFITDQPQIGAHNSRVIFIHPKSTDGVLIELVEKH